MMKSNAEHNYSTISVPVFRYTPKNDPRKRVFFVDSSRLIQTHDKDF
jgi:hypothetical protein